MGWREDACGSCRPLRAGMSALSGHSRLIKMKRNNMEKGGFNGSLTVSFMLHQCLQLSVPEAHRGFKRPTPSRQHHIRP